MGLIIPSIPYKSQYDPDADEFRNDCGPASLAMILNGFGINVSTNAVYRKTGAKANNYTSVSQLMRASLSYGLAFNYFNHWTVGRLTELIGEGRPVIALVHYGAWSQISPGISTQNTFQGPHFVVVTGFDEKYIYINDPLWRDERRSEGYRKAWTHEQFNAAWGANNLDGNTPHCGILCSKALPTHPFGGGTWLSPAGVLISPELHQRIAAWSMYRGMPEPRLDTPATVNAYLVAMGKWGQRIVTHQVSDEDDLGSLALKYYGDPQKWGVILAFNGLNPGDTVFDGDELRIPEPLEQPVRIPPEARPSGGTFYHAQLFKDRLNQPAGTLAGK
jgi:hypothetical protein